MKIVDGKLHLSATDLANFSSCHHATALDLGVARGERDKSSWFNPMADALRDRGIEHERRYVDSLRKPGVSVISLAGRKGDVGFAATVSAMREGVHAIVQATVQCSPWNGVADVLLRVDNPSELGDWSYIPIDTKLARETRAATVLQLSLYAELLRDIQGMVPAQFRVVVPAQDGESFEEILYRTGDFDAYSRFIRTQLDAATKAPSGVLEAATYPEPVDHCAVCKWWETCDKRRRTDDHLSLVAGASRLQRRELQQRAVATLAALAEVPVPLRWRPSRGSRESLERIREQARVQLAGRVTGKPVHEVLPLQRGQGFDRLPEPSPGDVFFDIEGDAFAGKGGREYLFGLAYLDEKATVVYDRYWASTASEERAAFENVMRFLVARHLEHPSFHVYHYAPYEPAALKRLMGRYATCEDAVDQLLRAEKFVDLFRVARQSIRASVERYSIKDLEVFYGFARMTDLRLASHCRRVVEKAIEGGTWSGVAVEVKTSIEDYNREDCLSARALRDWLETLRAQLERQGATIPRPESSTKTPGEEFTEKASATRQLIAHLSEGMPDEIKERTDEQQAKWLLAQELEFHRREDKSTWWEFHRLRRLDPDELLDERAALSGLCFLKRLPKAKGKKTEVDRYSFVVQDSDVKVETKLCLLGDGDPFGEIVHLDRVGRTVDIRKRKDTAEVHPAAVFAFDLIRSDALADSLFRFGERVALAGLDNAAPYAVAQQLLMRHPPRLRSGELNAGPDETTLELACRVATALDASVLPIQGPPGAGKTHAAAHMICALVRSGKKVGVTAGSHAVIHHVLEKVCEASATTAGTPVRCMKKADDEVDSSCTYALVKTSTAIFKALREGTVDVVGATAWLWAAPDAEACVDVLFVDEAGQVSLANALAVAPAARNMVLIGDPQQLNQPLKGSHPVDADVSALEHLFAGSETVREGAGIFLPETWRLSPNICHFTSEAFYEGRLRPVPGLEHQRLVGTTGIDGSGLWLHRVHHQGNQNSSIEEAQAVRQLVERLLVSGSQWLDKDGREHPLTEEDILVVAPYNAHVALISELLSPRVLSVGTVDKFQGQEAPVVIYSMATSTPDEAPRGMSFLYSLNRLNVATSRARCACILVANPQLFEPECRSVEHVRLANAFCRYVELAKLTTTNC